MDINRKLSNGVFNVTREKITEKISKCCKCKNNELNSTEIIQSI